MSDLYTRFIKTIKKEHNLFLKEKESWLYILLRSCRDRIHEVLKIQQVSSFCYLRPLTYKGALCRWCECFCITLFACVWGNEASTRHSPSLTFLPWTKHTYIQLLKHTNADTHTHTHLTCDTRAAERAHHSRGVLIACNLCSVCVCCVCLTVSLWDDAVWQLQSSP